MRMRKYQDLSIRSKTLWAAAVLVSLGFGILIAIVSLNVFDDARQNGYRQAREQAEAYTRQVSDSLTSTFEIPRYLARAVQGMQQSGLPERKTLDSMIIGMLGNAPQASGLWMLWEPDALDGKDASYRDDWPIHDPTGRYMPYMTRADNVIKQDNMLGADQLKAAEAFRNDPANYKPPYEQAGWGDFYLVPKQRGQDTITEPYPYEVQGKTTLLSSLVHVIHGDANKVLGVAGVDLPLIALQQSVGGFAPMGGGYTTLVSNGGLYVVVKDAALSGKPVLADDLSPEAMDKLKAGEGVEFERNDFLHVWRPVKVGESGQNWALGVSIPLAAIMTDAVSARTQAIITGSVAAIIVLALLSTLLATLMRPLHRLANTMEELASGEGDLTLRLQVVSRDEIGRTSEAFNRFVANLQSMFRQVREQSDAVEHAAESLGASTKKIEHASEKQAGAVQAISAGVEELTVSIQHIADTACQQESIARQTSSTTAEGYELVTEVARKIEYANESVTGLAETTLHLGEQSKRVDSIVSVIKEIADQTNLLALNAAIEAARAGEQGRGFAVVADEVRKLAARTSDATVEIGDIVINIQQEIQIATSKVSDTRGQIDEGVSRSRTAAAAIERVSADTGDLVSHVVEVANATREQATASTEIAQNIERISDLAESNRATMLEFGGSVRQLENLSTNLHAIVEKFKL